MTPAIPQCILTYGSNKGKQYGSRRKAFQGNTERSQGPSTVPKALCWLSECALSLVNELPGYIGDPLVLEAKAQMY